jgi:hypothetical protein
VLLQSLVIDDDRGFLLDAPAFRPLRKLADSPQNRSIQRTDRAIHLARIETGPVYRASRQPLGRKAL